MQTLKYVWDSIVGNTWAIVTLIVGVTAVILAALFLGQDVGGFLRDLLGL